MIKKEVQLLNIRGLHARAASSFVKVSSQFDSEIVIEKDGQTVNGKSILGIMAMAADYRSWITICIDGEDKEQAMKSLIELINNRFGEDE
jgi:phosphocarrier protein